MGVDWNKYAAGVNIVILEVCGGDYEEERFQNKIRLLYREEVVREEYTLLKGVDRVVELNSIFRPRHIYVDRGFGETQVELLRKHGTDHPESGLAQKLKGVGNESIEMRDPFTKQLIKKDAKPFLVDNLRSMFEKDMLRFPGEDPELGDGENDPNYDGKLYFDLISYIVSRVTPTGRNIYESPGDAEDHIIDALTFAAYAITENYDDLMKVEYETKAYSVSSEAFSPLMELATNPAVREKEEEIIEDKWGSEAKAPVKAQRAMTASISRGRRGKISRKVF
jgi:replicative DNA helicase